MSTTNKEILKAGVINGLIWTSILLVATYLYKRGLYLNYTPFWFLFFAGTGALRKYYQLRNNKD